MSYRLVILPRAQHDAQHIFDWLKEHSPDGATRWWNVLEEAASSLIDDPLSRSLAPETELVDYDLRQFLFKTRRGRTYRGVFLVIEAEVRILRVRGPGQPPLKSDELD